MVGTIQEREVPPYGDLPAQNPSIYKQALNRLPRGWSVLLLDERGETLAANEGAPQHFSRVLRYADAKELAKLNNGSLDHYELIRAGDKDKDLIHLTILAKEDQGGQRFFTALVQDITEEVDRFNFYRHDIKAILYNAPDLLLKNTEAALLNPWEIFPPGAKSLLQHAQKELTKLYFNYLVDQLTYRALKIGRYSPQITEGFTGASDPNERLFDSLPFGLAVMESDRIQRSNPVFQRLTGEYPGEKEQLAFPRPFSGNIDIASYLQVSAIEKGSYRFFKKFPAGSLSNRYLQFSVIPPQDASEKFLIIAEDVTYETQLMKGIKEASLERISSAWAYIQELKGKIDLNPKSYSPLARERIIYLNIMLKDMFQAAGHEFKYPPESARKKVIKLSEFFGQFIADPWHSHPGQKVSLELRVEGEPRVNMVEKDLRSMTDVLFYNACHAEADLIIISCHLTEDERNVIVSFRDNGIGLPKDQIREISKAHYSSTKPLGEGYGLKQATKIAEKSDGRVEEISSQQKDETHPNSGTVFKIRLPAYSP